MVRSAHLERFPKYEQLTLALVLVTVVLLASWMGAGGGGYFVDQWAPAALVLAALALITSVTGVLRGARSRWGNAALGLFAAYTAWTFASLLWSPNLGDAWTGAGQTLLYLLVFWLTVGLVSLEVLRRWALAASAIGPALIAALTLLTLAPRIHDLFYSDRLIGTVSYYNGEAAFLLVPFWVAVYLAGSPGVNPLLRGLLLAGAVLSVDVAVLTQSRGAMAAMAASLPVFFLISGQRLRGLFALAPVALALVITFPSLNEVYLAFLNQESELAAIEHMLPIVWLTAAAAGLYGVLWGLIDQRWRPPSSLVRVTGSIALAGSIIVLIFGAVVVSERVGNPIAWAEQTWEAWETYDKDDPREAYKAYDGFEQNQSRYLGTNTAGRYTLWQVAWEDFVSHPLLGVGTQNYEATYFRLREKDAGYARQPHSLPLEVLAERGVVGGALFFGFLATCLGAGLWERFRHLGSEGKAQVGAMTAAVTYWFVHSSAEWFWQLPAVTLPAMVYLAMLVGPWRRIESAPLRWPLRAVGAGVALLAGTAIAPLYAADRYVAQSYSTTNQSEALSAVERGQRLNPVNPELPEREAELAMQIGDWDQAEEAYHRVIQLNPEHYAPYGELAKIYEQGGDLAGALSSYQDALAINPLDDELNSLMIGQVGQVPVGHSVSVRYMKGPTELGRSSLTKMATGATAPERSLQGPFTLAPEVGVLFVWPDESMQPLEVKNTPSSLDIASIDTLGRVTEIRSTARPNEEALQPQQPYRLTILADYGFFERNNIRVGSQAVFAVSPYK